MQAESVGYQLLRAVRALLVLRAGEQIGFEARIDRAVKKLWNRIGLAECGGRREDGCRRK